MVSHILERGPPSQKIACNRKKIYFKYPIIIFTLLVYFQSLDMDNDHLITRTDLEACLPPTVESQQLIQQLLRQWDMVNLFVDSSIFLVCIEILESRWCC